MAKRILVVDDSQMTRIMVQRAIRSAGAPDAEFVEATNGAQAQELLREGGFDLVVTDLYMDRVTGLELVKGIREGGSDVPICMVTSERSPEILAEARAAGVDWLVSKPFRPVEFRAVLSA